MTSGRSRDIPFNKYDRGNSMKNQFTLHAIAAMLCGFMPIPAGVTHDQLTSMTPHSRGKSGKVSGKRTNAATFKRAAKKLKNIRKHK